MVYVSVKEIRKRLNDNEDKFCKYCRQTIRPIVKIPEDLSHYILLCPKCKKEIGGGGAFQIGRLIEALRG